MRGPRLHGDPQALPHLGQDVAVGIRPEHLLPAAREEDAFEAVVEVVEPVGSEVFANLRLGAHELVARFGPQVLPEVGQRLRIAVQPGAAHFFDPASGRRLEPG